MTNRPGDRHVLHPGDKVMKIGDYNIPGEVRCRFIMTTGVVRYAVEHKAEGGGRFVHIYADKNLELVERGFEDKREDSEISGGATEMTAAPLDLNLLEAAERVATRAPWRHEPMYPMMIGHRNVVHTGGADPVHFGVSEHKDGSFEDAVLTVTLRNAATALFAAARERDKLREALEAAEPIVALFANYSGHYVEGFHGPKVRELNASYALAKARAALGKPSVTEPQAGPHLPTP